MLLAMSLSDSNELIVAYIELLLGGASMLQYMYVEEQGRITLPGNRRLCPETRPESHIIPTSINTLLGQITVYMMSHITSKMCHLCNTMIFHKCQ